MLTEQQLLTVWERTEHAADSDWALGFLCALFPALPREALSGLSVLHRDALLMQVRSALFGERLSCEVHCPHCSEKLEWTTCETDIGLASSKPLLSLSGACSRLHNWRIGDIDVRVREPTSADIAAARRSARAERDLLRRLILSARRDGQQLDTHQLSDSLLIAVADQLQECASEVSPDFALTCPACDAGFASSLDCAAFLRGDLSRWANKLLRTIATLAANFGWTEQEILALNPKRRSSYLTMVSS